jgi:hypothetical protein
MTKLNDESEAMPVCDKEVYYYEEEDSMPYRYFLAGAGSAVAAALIGSMAVAAWHNPHAIGDALTLQCFGIEDKPSRCGPYEYGIGRLIGGALGGIISTTFAAAAYEVVQFRSSAARLAKIAAVPATVTIGTLLGTELLRDAFFPVAGAMIAGGTLGIAAAGVRLVVGEVVSAMRPLPDADIRHQTSKPGSAPTRG